MGEEQKGMTAEDIAKATGGEVMVDDWDKGEEIPSSWFKFEKVGDMIMGTLIGKRFQKSTNPIYPDQWVYELKTKTGVTNVGMSKDYVNNKMKYVAIGQKVGFKYLADVPSQKFKGKVAKSLDVKIFGFDEDYAEPVEESDEIDVSSVPFV